MTSSSMTIDGLLIAVKRTNRSQTISIKVDGAGVRVLAPRHLGDRKIRNLVEQKTGWIAEKLRQQAARPKPVERRFVTGERFLWHGAPLILAVADGPSIEPEMRHGTLYLQAPARRRGEGRSTSVRHQLEWWYRAEAEKLLRGATAHHAACLGMAPRSVSLKTYKARWGSCSHDGDITYDWRLVMAPTVVGSYVAAHEIAHLAHLDHSPAFWQCVRRLCPTFKDQRDWLKHNGQTLVL